MTHRNKTKTNVNAFQIRNKTNTIPCHCTLLRTFSEKPTLTVQKISWNEHFGTESKISICKVKLALLTHFTIAKRVLLKR